MKNPISYALKIESDSVQFERLASDINGNPRYVFDFNCLLSHNERQTMRHDDAYALACKRANSIGGRRYHNKSCAYGIVIQSYSLQETRNAIARIQSTFN